MQEVSPEAVREQLARILTSAGFAQSERLRRFLQFVVDEALAGHAGRLKESVLAIEVFDRGASYDSSSDAIVRVEARRLRTR